MIKREELTNPASCMSRAGDDEMTFVLLGRDIAAPAAIHAWILARVLAGKNTLTDPQVLEAITCSANMERSRREVVRMKADPAHDSNGKQYAGPVTVWFADGAKEKFKASEWWGPLAADHPLKDEKWDLEKRVRALQVSAIMMLYGYPIGQRQGKDGSN